MCSNAFRVWSDDSDREARQFGQVKELDDVDGGDDDDEADACDWAGSNGAVPSSVPIVSHIVGGGFESTSRTTKVLASREE